MYIIFGCSQPLDDIGTSTTPTPLSSTNEITSFIIAGLSGPIIVSIEGTEITVTVPFGTDLSALTPTLVHTGTGVSPASGSARDFSSPVVYTVTAADGTTAEYTVTVSEAPSNAKEITSFVFEASANAGLGSDVTATVDGTAITATLPGGTNLSTLVPTLVHTGTGVSPASGSAQDFSSPLTYTVTAADGSTTEYTVTITMVCTVTYNGNGADGGTVPLSQTYSPGDTVSVAANSGNLVKMQDGISLRMAEWNTAQNGSEAGYTPGSGTFVIGNSDVILYADWDVIGGTGPGGGLVFYDKGSVSGSPGWRYMEVSLTNAAEIVPWGGSGIDVPNAEGTAVGTGWENTKNIVATLGELTSAAKACYQFEQEGCSLWYLPSQLEMEEIVANLYDNGLGNFDPAVRYWTSTETSATAACDRGFGLSEGTAHDKNTASISIAGSTLPWIARPVHSFVSQDVLMVHFDSQADEGPATPEWVENIAAGDTLTSLPVLPERTGYSFSGWYTLPDGGGTELSASTPIWEDMQVFAYWVHNEYTIQFDGNECTGGTAPDSGTYYYNDTITLPAHGTLEKYESQIYYRFTGWNTAADGTGDSYAAGAAYTVGTESETFYAQWDLIGGRGPGDGYVFYDSGEIGTKGWRYMEAAPADQSGGIWWWDWNTYTTMVGTATGLGTGVQNTLDITLMGDGYDYAAKVVWFDYSNNGYNDWVLPSLDELQEIYNALHLKGIGGFSTSLPYWSSSESSSTYAYYFDFNSNSSTTSHKGSNLRVRGVRYF